MIAPNTTEKQFNEVEAEVLGHDELFPDDLNITKAEFLAWKLNRCIVHIVFEQMVNKPESNYTRERFDHIINSTHNIQIGPELCKRLFKHSPVPCYEPEDIEFRDDDGNERMERQSDIQGTCSKINRDAGKKFIIFLNYCYQAKINLGEYDENFEYEFAMLWGSVGLVDDRVAVFDDDSSDDDEK